MPPRSWIEERALGGENVVMLTCLIASEANLWGHYIPYHEDTAVEQIKARAGIWPRGSHVLDAWQSRYY